MSKKLVTYFSATGRTAKAARILASIAEADLYEIKPEIPYTKSDLNWMNPFSRSTKEMKKRTFRPAIANKGIDISAYGVIFVGFPIWWYVAPTIINTFLEKYDFSNKKIVLFATSGGSGFGKTVNGLVNSVASSAEIQEGIIMNGLSEDAVKEWLNGLTV